MIFHRHVDRYRNIDINVYMCTYAPVYVFIYSIALKGLGAAPSQ